MSDLESKDFLPKDRSKATPEEIREIDKKKQEFIDLSDQILEIENNRDMMSKQLAIIQFSEEIGKRIDEAVEDINRLIKKLKSAYEAFVAVGGNPDELSGYFEKFKLNSLDINEDEMFDAD